MNKSNSPDPAGQPAHPPQAKAVRILALDLGSDTGWYSLSAHVREIGTIHLSKTATHGARYCFFKQALQNLLVSVRPQLVAYEHVRAHSSSDAAHMYGALLGILQAHCHDFGIDLMGLEVSTIKKHATGKGNANKEEMVAAAQARGWIVSDHNQADAYWIHDLAMKITRERSDTTEKPCQPDNPSCQTETTAPPTGKSASIGCSGKPKRPAARTKRSSKPPTESESATSAP